MRELAGYQVDDLDDLTHDPPVTAWKLGLVVPAAPYRVQSND